MELTQEQQMLIQKAKAGHNVLVDACIGSGKTTTIQALCNELPETTRILYLTYNKLLKLEAQRKIQKPNIFVSNYHGFAWKVLTSNNMRSSVSGMIQMVIDRKPPMPEFDLLVLDEYQDIDQEISEMLEYIKIYSPNIQIIAVGDMQQKIYDKTTLDVKQFINDYLGKHDTIEFTQCFRLPKKYAAKLGRIWEKEIVGVNPDCTIEKMNLRQAVNFLASQEPEDVLCLGSRYGQMAKALNWLEDEWPEKFNKHTVYASISDGSTVPTDDAAIFTTFDSSKGMEKDICVVFDYDTGYWETRLHKPQQSYDILRNIFLVAASRGKRHIIFVPGKSPMIEERDFKPEKQEIHFEDTNFMGLFNFKYREDVQEAFHALDIKDITDETGDVSEISIPENDGLIALDPVIKTYILASYFKKYDLDYDIDQIMRLHFDSGIEQWQKELPIEKKVLELIALSTTQNRYREQVKVPYLNQQVQEKLHARLATQFDKTGKVQIPAHLDFYDENGDELFTALDTSDIMTKEAIYSVTYTAEPSPEEFNAVACQMIAQKKKKGILWNLYNNHQYEITIPDQSHYLDLVAKTATKGYLKEY